MSLKVLEATVINLRTKEKKKRNVCTCDKLYIKKKRTCKNTSEDFTGD